MLGTYNPPQPKPNEALNNLMQFFTKDLSTDIATQYSNAVTNNPQYLAKAEELSGISKDLAGVNANLRALGDDVRKKYSAGTPESLIASATAREAKPLMEQAQYLFDLQTNATTELNRISQDSKEMFSIQQEERNRNQTLAFQLYNTVNAEEIRQEDIVRADEELRIKMEQSRTEQEFLIHKDQRDYNFKVAEAIYRKETSRQELELKTSQSNRDFDLKVFEANKQKASDFLQFKTTNED